ncbi:MAG: hypothetical protein ACR2KT_06370, partial [Methylocella sp.]
SAASDQRNPIAPSHRSHWSNSKRFFESDLLAARKGYFSRCPLSQKELARMLDWFISANPQIKIAAIYSPSYLLSEM